MKYVLHKSDTRGRNEYSWLKSFPTFSFADYYDKQRMNFGVLRVLNDDYISPKMGFDTHPHDNMEIISIPINGEMEHKDNLGNHVFLKEGEIQMMSAGSWILHSEYNRSNSEINFLQIWIYPNEFNKEPSYRIVKTEKNGDDPFRLIISNNDDDNALLKIKQNAKLYLGYIDDSNKVELEINSRTNGMYLFVIEGEIYVAEQVLLQNRDGIGIWDIDKISFIAKSKSRLLAIDVPMKR